MPFVAFERLQSFCLSYISNVIVVVVVCVINSSLLPVTAHTHLNRDDVATQQAICLPLHSSSLHHFIPPLPFIVPSSEFALHFALCFVFCPFPFLYFSIIYFSFQFSSAFLLFMFCFSLFCCCLCVASHFVK